MAMGAASIIPPIEKYTEREVMHMQKYRKYSKENHEIYKKQIQQKFFTLGDPDYFIIM